MPARCASRALLRFVRGFVMGDMGHEIGIVLGAGGNLNHRDANPGREELLGIGSRVGFVAVLILHHQIHLLDALGPD